MSIKPSTICIFCEDIREEKSGQDTIVGTLPDNVVVEVASSLTPMIPKLGIYVRLNFSVDNGSPKEVSAKVLNTKGDFVTQTWWTSEVVNQAFDDAKAKHFPLVGLICKFLVRPLPIQESGQIRVTASIDGEEYLAGTLNVIVSNVSSQAAAQSLSSAQQS